MSDDQSIEQQAQEQVIPGVTPAALLDVMENPDAFAEIARGDLYVQMAKMRALSHHPEFPASQRIEYAKFLAKMGKVDAPDKADNPLAGVPLIEIDLGAAGSVKIGGSPTPPPRAEKDITPADDEVVRPSKAVLP